MSRDYREVALERALKHGVPYVHQVGAVTSVVTAVHRQLDGRLRGAVTAKEWPSAGAAREFARRAVTESGWKSEGVAS